MHALGCPPMTERHNKLSAAPHGHAQVSMIPISPSHMPDDTQQILTVIAEWSRGNRASQWVAWSKLCKGIRSHSNLPYSAAIHDATLHGEVVIGAHPRICPLGLRKSLKALAIDKVMIITAVSPSTGRTSVVGYTEGLDLCVLSRWFSFYHYP